MASLQGGVAGMGKKKKERESGARGQGETSALRESLEELPLKAATKQQPNQGRESGPRKPPQGEKGKAFV